jgi:hypothetical protein
MRAARGLPQASFEFSYSHSRPSTLVKVITANSDHSKLLKVNTSRLTRAKSTSTTYRHASEDLHRHRQLITPRPEPTVFLPRYSLAVGYSLFIQRSVFEIRLITYNIDPGRPIRAFVVFVLLVEAWSHRNCLGNWANDHAIQV